MRHELSAAAAQVALALREADQIAARRPPFAAAPAARTQQVNGGPAAAAVALRSLHWPHLLLLLARERRRSRRRGVIDAAVSYRRRGRVPRPTGRYARQMVRAGRAVEVRAHLLVRTVRAVVVARVGPCNNPAGAETSEARCTARRALGEQLLEPLPEPEPSNVQIQSMMYANFKGPCSFWNFGSTRSQRHPPEIIWHTADVPLKFTFKTARI